MCDYTDFWFIIKKSKIKKKNIYLNLQTDWQVLLVGSCHLKLEAQTSKNQRGEKHFLC